MTLTPGQKMLNDYIAAGEVRLVMGDAGQIKYVVAKGDGANFLQSTQLPEAISNLDERAAFATAHRLNGKFFVSDAKQVIETLGGEPAEALLKKAKHLRPFQPSDVREIMSFILAGDLKVNRNILRDPQLVFLTPKAADYLESFNIPVTNVATRTNVRADTLVADAKEVAKLGAEVKAAINQAGTISYAKRAAENPDAGLELI